MFDLITIGDATIDTFLILDDTSACCELNKKKSELCLNYADKITIVGSAQSVGGDAANVAVGARKLGLKTAIVTELGDDVNGQIIEDDLRKAHVDTSMARRLTGRDTRYSVVLNYQAERTILSYHAPRAYTLPPLPKAKCIYYTSLGHSFEKLQDKLADYLKKNPDVKLAMNPGSYQFKQNAMKIKELFSRTDVLFVNKEEAERLVGRKKNMKATIRALHTHGIGTVVVTNSDEGAYASDREEMLYMPTYPVKPIAKTGAGDAFASGCLTALIQGKELSEALRWGTGNAAGVIQQFGAQKGLLSKNVLLKLIQKYKHIRAKKLA